MIELKTPKEIEAMKPAGRFVGGILRDLKEFTKVGTNLLEIDEFVHKRIVDRKGASSCYVDYAPDFGTGPFAHYICTSVNDAVLHGVPYDYNLKDGDLVSLDLAGGGLEPVGGVAQEDHTQHRHAVLAGGELGIGAELVRRLPQVIFQFRDIAQRAVQHHYGTPDAAAVGHHGQQRSTIRRRPGNGKPIFGAFCEGR